MGSVTLPPLEQAAVGSALSAALAAVSAGGTLAPGRFVVVPRAESTSTDLVAAVRDDDAAWPDRSVLVADHQVAGRGRAGRTWTTPPGTALTFSVLLRPQVPLERLGWVPLLAGLAVVRALGDAGARASVKWPNDVLVPAPDGLDLPGWGTSRKVAGVLGDLVTAPGRTAVVVGIGINVAQQARDLPVESATSLALVLDEAPDRVALLAAVVGRLVELDQRWRAADGDAWAAGIGAECSAACATLGRPVRVELPGGGVLQGRADALGPDGALEVVDAAGRREAVRAGDVRHVRGVA